MTIQIPTIKIKKKYLRGYISKINIYLKNKKTEFWFYQYLPAIFFLV